MCALLWINSLTMPVHDPSELIDPNCISDGVLRIYVKFKMD